MSFPQFYLHYNSKDDKILGVTREDKNDDPFVILIRLEESMSKKLLNGEMSEMDLIVNKYANPPYALDKRVFPKDQSYYLLFDVDTQDIQKIQVKKPDPVLLKQSKQDFAEVDSRVAYSILAGDTTFQDWKITKNVMGELSAVYDPADGTIASSLFKNRIDFLSLVEIDLSAARKHDKSMKRMCEISVDQADNSITITCDELADEAFKEFFIAVTNKNDPSYLIKMIQLAPKKVVKIEFVGNRLENMSFFTSRFHLRNSDISIKNLFTGTASVKFSKNDVTISNNLSFNDHFTDMTIILKNKYDHTIVYRTVNIVDNNPISFALNSLDPDIIDIDALKLSKKFITVSR